MPDEATRVGSMQLSLPFTHHGLDGTVRVEIRPNADPRATAHAEVAANFDEQAFRGFPLATAEVDYPGEGPRGWFAWIQWVKHVRSGTVLTVGLDTPPWLDGPFYVIGYRPTFADAPSNPDHLDLDWIATTFLTATKVRAGGDSVGTSVLIPLAGFVWGYRRHGPEDPTELLPPTIATSTSWAELGPLLSAHPWLEPARP